MASLNERKPQDMDRNAPRAERIVAACRAYEQDRRQMTSVLARQYDLTELEIVQALSPEQATPLDVTQWETIIRSFEEVGNVHVIMSNSSGVLEVFGEFGNFSRTGPFFNVQTKTVDMHLRPETFARIFAIEKPSHMDGVSTLSIQFYNQDGHAAFKVFFTFGGNAPSPERRAQWEAIKARCQVGV